MSLKHEHENMNMQQNLPAVERDDYGAKIFKECHICNLFSGDYGAKIFKGCDMFKLFVVDYGSKIFKDEKLTNLVTRSTKSCGICRNNLHLEITRGPMSTEDCQASHSQLTKIQENPVNRHSWVTEPGISRHRPLDYILCLYYIYQVICTTFIYTQGVYPYWMYPSWLRAVHKHYVDTFHDPFLNYAWKYPWYLSMCLVEHSLGIPFFVWACYCYYYGVMNRPYIIFPSIIYCTYTIASVLAVWSMALLEDFSRHSNPAPRTVNHRMMLLAVYSHKLIFSFINLVDSYILASDVIFRPIE